MKKKDSLFIVKGSIYVAAYNDSSFYVPITFLFFSEIDLADQNYYASKGLIWIVDLQFIVCRQTEQVLLKCNRWLSYNQQLYLPPWWWNYFIRTLGKTLHKDVSNWKKINFLELQVDFLYLVPNPMRIFWWKNYIQERIYPLLIQETDQ